MHSFPEYKIKIHGIKINYVKIGKGKPLIFIHGWANNWEGWIPLVKYLKDHFTLYLLDLPGFGHSASLDKYSVGAASSFVTSFIRKLALKSSGIIGLSMGSFVAADIARRNPTLSESVILLGPLVKDTADRWLYRLVPSYLKIFNRNFLSRGILKKIIQSSYTAYIVSKYINMYKFNKKYIDKYGTHGRKLMRTEAFIDIGLSVSSYDLKKTLLKIETPALMIYGREDKIASFKVAQKLLPQNTNLSLEIIPYCGHMPHWEDPPRLAKIIKKFAD